MKTRIALTALGLLAAVLCTAAAVEALRARAPAPPPQEIPPQADALAEIEDPRTLTLEHIRALSFPDVERETLDAVRYVVFRELMAPEADGRFLPDRPATRLQAREALEGLRGGPLSWPQEAEPGALLTREGLAEDLLCYAGDAGLDTAVRTEPERFPDLAPEAGSLSWALAAGLLDTMVCDTVYPALPVSRAQLAQTLTALAALEGEALAAGLDLPEPPGAESASREGHEELQAAVDAAAAKYGAVGIQVAVIEDGAVTDTYGSGWATRGADPMTADHKLRTASITKVAVGLSALLLREAGTVDYDVSVGDYWGLSVRNPSYPDDPVSLRTLLSHTSSLGDFDGPWTHGAAASHLSGGGFRSVRPGDMAGWSYNNYAFGVLGMTLELASGQYLDDVLRQGLFDVMEIDGAFESGCIQDKERLATLYYHDGSVSRSAAAQAGIGRSGGPGSTGVFFMGGLTISARDLGKLAALLAGGGCYGGVELLERESVELMETYLEEPIPDGTGSYQALPLRYQADLYGREGLYYHTGSAYGVYNWFSYDPHTGDGVVVLTTGAGGEKDERGIYAVCGEIGQAVYDRIAR